MANITISTRTIDNGVRVVKFVLGGPITPVEGAESVAQVDDLSGSTLLITDGQGPVWLHAMLAHRGHASPAVACYDPRLLGAVVVATHSPAYKVGEVIPYISPK